MKSLLLLFSILIFHGNVNAEILLPSLEAPADAAWSEFGRDVVTARVGLNLSQLYFDVEDLKGDGKRINYRPNEPSSYFVSAAYDWFSLRIAVPGGPGSERLPEKGKTSAQDYQVRLNFRQLSLEGFYQNYEGYYVANSSNFEAPIGKYLVSPMLRNEHVGVGLIWNFNPDDYSIAASFDQTAEQLMSGWSWLGGAAYHTNRFTTPISLVPDSNAAAYGAFTDVRSARLNSFLLGGGLGGAWVFREGWFLSAAGMLYAGLERSRVEKTSGQSYDSYMPAKYMLKGAIGYNGKKYLAGLSGQSDGSMYSVENSRMIFVTANAAVFVGAHLNP